MSQPTQVMVNAPPPGAAFNFAAHLIALNAARPGKTAYIDDAGTLSYGELADSHGRVHVISPDVAASQTGHGNVMPQSLHGGPGRAGGGEELGGLRALNFYHRRAAIQASTAVLDRLAPPSAA